MHKLEGGSGAQCNSHGVDGVGPALARPDRTGAPFFVRRYDHYMHSAQTLS